MQPFLDQESSEGASLGNTVTLCRSSLESVYQIITSQIRDINTLWQTLNATQLTGGLNWSTEMSSGKIIKPNTLIAYHAKCT